MAQTDRLAHSHRPVSWRGPLAMVVVAVTLAAVLSGQIGGSGSPIGARPAPSAGQSYPGGHAHAAAAMAKATPDTAASSKPLPLKLAVGQLIIATYAGEKPPAKMLAAVRAGQVGAIILMGDNTAGGVTQTRAAVTSLQRAASAGGNRHLLVMTDQEGGEVKRLSGAPAYSASQMSKPKVALQQGAATAKLLKRAGVNVDLAPVADVSRTDGFMTQEERTFGATPKVVAAAACAFAKGLSGGGVAYTLKHFPGLGDATDSTDDGPVSVAERASDISADGQAYRQCGHSSMALVMVSSASYTHLTGSVPAVFSPKIYRTVMPRDKIDALAISDSFETGAIDGLKTPARRAVSAGLDMVMYANHESASAAAYVNLLKAAQSGQLSQARVQAAAAKVLALKHTLGLS